MVFSAMLWFIRYISTLSTYKKEGFSYKPLRLGYRLQKTEYRDYRRNKIDITTIRNMHITTIRNMLSFSVNPDAPLQA